MTQSAILVPPQAATVEPLADPGSTTARTQLRRVLGTFPTGVTAVAGIVSGAPVGFAANSFTSVSLDPALVAICVAHSSTTWPTLVQAERIGVSVLAVDQGQVCTQLSARVQDRFQDVDWHANEGGAVFIRGASAWLDCAVEVIVPAGDHDIVVMAVHGLGIDQGVDPLVFHASRFNQLAIRGPRPLQSAFRPHTSVDALW